MEKIKKLLKIVRKFENVIHKSEYEQFTIDFVQNNAIDLISFEDATDLTDQRENDIVGAFHYDVICILDIIKEGKDKKLFVDLENEIENL